MGAQLACLLAGAGARVRLLDLDRGLAEEGLARARKARPTPLYRPSDADRIAVGGLDELEDAVAVAEWVLEAVVEDLDAKRDLLGRVDEALGKRPEGPNITTNTSALPVRAMAEDRSVTFRKAFLGTHFFNPPRYTRLLELVPLDETDVGRIAWLEAFASRHLGKGTVRAKDTPAFIANRLGTHGMLTALALAQEYGLGPDEVDDLTGPLLGRPRSATFRTLDLVGLDIALAVADHCHAALPDDPERERFEAPPVLRQLVERRALGEKTGAGFYRRRDAEILALDLETLEYRPRRRVSSPTVERARNETDLGRRLSLLIHSDDAALRFLWRLLSATLRYAATVGPEIADDAWTVDQAMRWGYGWELGPFQTWDALGPASLVERMEAEGGIRGAAGRVVPDLARTAAGQGSFYREAEDGVHETLALASASYRPVPVRTWALDPAERRAAARRAGLPELPGNASASMVELGEGILGLELHGKLNVIGLDTIAMLLHAAELAERTYDGLVIGTRAADFSAGANLALLLLEAEEGEWEELDMAIRRFQQAAMRMRYASVPVVVAPRGRTLGGGAELCFPADRRQALAETYIGSTESALGLIPAGGGSTHLARRAAEAVPDGLPADPFPFFRRAFETAAFARVSTGAEDARDLGLLEPSDLVTADPDRQWADSVAVARQLAEAGYRPPIERPIRVLGSRGIAAAEALTYNELAGRRLSEHDRKVALELARVMCGGDVAEGTAVAEGYLLELERQAFLRLLGEPKTRERIRFTLKTGKPLRN